MNRQVTGYVVIEGRQPTTTLLRKLAEDFRAIFAPSPRHGSLENGAAADRAAWPRAGSRWG